MRDNREEQRVTAAGIAKGLLPKVQGLSKKLKDDVELLDYANPEGAKGRSRLDGVEDHLSDIERQLRGTIEE